jgi:diaminopimelate epimerase
MRFSKWHALGNSYLVVRREDAAEPLNADVAARLCDPGRGIGSDGVLEVVRVDGERAEVVIWNPDGTTTEMSGNGTRIAARWLADDTGATDVTISVAGRRVEARMREDGLVETDVGAFQVSAQETVDVHGNPVEVIPVSVGNPHAVVACEEPDREVLLRLGPLIEVHQRFPERTNVQFVHADGPHHVRALVWERGAGETSASGSSAVAVAAALVADGSCTSPVIVHMPGGELEVRLENGTATLIGPAEEICRGIVVY